MTQSLNVNNSRYAMKANSEDKKFYVFDIETDNLYDKVTTIHCIVIHDVYGDKTFTYGPDRIDDALEYLAGGDVLIGHNILFYDIPVIRKLFPLYNFRAARIIDTLICTRLIWPKEKLYELDCEQYNKVPEKLRGSASLKAWGYRLSDNKIEFKDFSAYSQEMVDYCKQDVSITSKLFKLIQDQNYPESSIALEHYFATGIEKQIRSGFPFDFDRCLDFMDGLRTRAKELESELKKIFPPIEHKEIFIPKVNNKNRGYVKGVPFEKIRIEEFNPGSRQQVVERLKQKYGWVPEKLTEKGNPILDDEVIEKLPYPEAKLLNEYMLIEKRLGQIVDGNNAWIKLFNNDTNCIHGDLITNGCITGRCAHRNPNMGQVPAAYSPYGKECRSLFTAPDGWSLIGVDAKALELRCLAGYLAIWDDGEYASVVTNPEIDIHVYNQEKFGVETRDISKRLLYALLYSCGAVKAGTIINPNEKDSEVLRELGSNAINSFMRGVPALKKLKNEISQTIQDRGWLYGLDRRILYCRSDYKGLNVLLQSSGALIMKQVVINLHESMDQAGYQYGVDWQQHAMIHDEIQLSCQPGLVEIVKEKALSAFPKAQKFFGFQCPIQGDAKVGFSWFDTH